MLYNAEQDIVLIKNFIDEEKRNFYFQEVLANSNWQNELTSLLSPTPIKIKRKMDYVYDKKIIYQYANLEVNGSLWREPLIEINNKIKTELGLDFNSVLLNLYESGKSEIGWHSDKEKQLGENPIIASVNLGAKRTIWFLNKETKEKFKYELEGGDILIMGKDCQTKYLHAILKEKDVIDERISLTFRKVYE